MIKTSSALMGLLVLCLCMACSKSAEKQTPNGIKFTVVKAGNNVPAKSGQSVVFHYVIKDSKDSIWNSSYNSGVPGVLPIGDSTNIKDEPGILQLGRMVSAGDSVTLTLPVNKFFKEIFGAQPAPNMDTTKTMTFTFQVKEFIESRETPKYMEAIMVKRAPKQKAKEIKQIDDFLTEKGIKAEQDSSGLRYVLHTNNGGAKPTMEGCVDVAYEGKLFETNKTFDAAESAVFPLQGVIRGWTYGIPKLGVGDSATLYIPSALAYGPRGGGPIPGDAILIFTVKLKSIGTKFDEMKRLCE